MVDNSKVRLDLMYQSAIGFLYMPSNGALIKFPYSGGNRASHHRATFDNAEQLGISQDQLTMECEAFNKGSDIGAIPPSLYARLPKGTMMTQYDEYMTYSRGMVRGIYVNGTLSVDCLKAFDAKRFINALVTNGMSFSDELIVEIDTLILGGAYNPTSLNISDPFDLADFMENGKLKRHFVVGRFAEDDDLDLPGEPDYVVLSRSIMGDVVAKPHK